MTGHWLKIADQAAELLDRMPGGRGVLARRAQIAAAFSITQGTLHNYLAAREFIGVVRAVDAFAADAMCSLPATAVGAYSRWWQREPLVVAEHAMMAAQEKWSSARIVAAERANRLSYPTSDLLDLALAQQRNEPETQDVSPVLAAAFRRLGISVPPLRELNRYANNNPLSRSMGAADVLRRGKPKSGESRHGPIESIWANSAEGSVDLLAVLQMRRGEADDNHRRGARNIVARAALAATAHPAALILLPDAEALEQFIQAVPAVIENRVGHSDGLHAFAFGGPGIVLVMEAAGFKRAWSGLGA